MVKKLFITSSLLNVGLITGISMYASSRFIRKMRAERIQDRVDQLINQISDSITNEYIHLRIMYSPPEEGEELLNLYSALLTKMNRAETITDAKDVQESYINLKAAIDRVSNAHNNDGFLVLGEDDTVIKYPKDMSFEYNQDSDDDDDDYSIVSDEITVDSLQTLSNFQIFNNESNDNDDMVCDESICADEITDESNVVATTEDVEIPETPEVKKEKQHNDNRPIDIQVDSSEAGREETSMQSSDTTMGTSEIKTEEKNRGSNSDSDEFTARDVNRCVAVVNELQKILDTEYERFEEADKVCGSQFYKSATKFIYKIGRVRDIDTHAYKYYRAGFISVLTDYDRTVALSIKELMKYMNEIDDEYGDEINAFMEYLDLITQLFLMKS